MSSNHSPGVISKLRTGLAKTGSAMTGGMGDVLRGKRKIDDQTLEDIETHLLSADVGIEATERIIEVLKQAAAKSKDDVRSVLRQCMIDLLAPCEEPLDVYQPGKPFVLLVVGINGAGKTTTIGKLAHRFSAAGNKVVLAAGDTFRAAAVEQLQQWGERSDIPVIAQSAGADSAAVVYDALESAKARGASLLIADTAGRLHTQDNLMSELAKVKRVLGRLDEEAPQETLLVLDGGTGQNAIRQAENFHKEIGITGLAITKLDGTAKGGVLFAIAERLRLPIRYIGVGEGVDDLRVFSATEFVDALLAGDD